MPRKDNPELLITAVRLSKETRDKLNFIKIIPEETIESVIKRLIKEHKEFDKIEELIK